MRDETWFVELYERRCPAVLAYGVRRIGPEQAREVTQRASSAIAIGVAARLDPMSSVDSVIDVRAALLLVEWEGVDHAAGGRSPGTWLGA